MESTVEHNPEGINSDLLMTDSQKSTNIILIRKIAYKQFH